MTGFLVVIWSIGFSMTLVALATRLLVLQIRECKLADAQARRPQRVPSNDVADFVRAALWPIFLWRPW